MTTASETQSQTQPLQSAAPSKQSGRKSIMALAVFALAINGTAAIYTLPSFDIPLPNVGSLAELLPHQKASAPTPDPVLAALKDIQSAQQQHAVALRDNGSSLQQNAALLQQDSTTFVSLRQSITDEHVDVKKISAQLSTLIAKVDSLQNTIAPEITSSISRGHARKRFSAAMRRRMMARPFRPVGPVSVGGAPLSFPVGAPAPQG